MKAKVYIVSSYFKLRERVRRRPLSSCHKALQITTSSPAHLFAIRGRRKRGPGTLQTRD